MSLEFGVAMVKSGRDYILNVFVVLRTERKWKGHHDIAGL